MRLKIRSKEKPGPGAQLGFRATTLLVNLISQKIDV